MELFDSQLVVRICALEQLEKDVVNFGEDNDSCRLVLHKIVTSFLQHQFYEKKWSKCYIAAIERLMVVPFNFPVHMFVLRTALEVLPALDTLADIRTVQILQIILSKVSDDVRSDERFIVTVTDIVGAVLTRTFSCSTNDAAKQCISRLLTKCMVTCPYLFSTLAIKWHSDINTAAKTLSSPYMKSLHLFGLVCSMWWTVSKDSPMRAEILEVYSQHVIAAIGSPNISAAIASNASLLGVYHGLLVSLTEDEWKQLLEPQVVKYMKKSPDSIAAVLSTLVSQLQFNVLQSVALVEEGAVSSFICRLLKSDKTTVTALGLTLTYQLTINSHGNFHFQSFRQLVSALVDSCHKAPAPLPVVRFQLYSALQYCGDYISILMANGELSSSDATELSDWVSSILSTLFNLLDTKELNTAEADVLSSTSASRWACCSLIATFLAFCNLPPAADTSSKKASSSSTPPSPLAAITKGCGAANTAISYMYILVLSVSKNDTLLENFTPIIKSSCFTYIKDCVGSGGKKSASATVSSNVAVLGALSLSLICQGARVSTDIAGLLEGAPKVLACLTPSNTPSFLFSPAFLSAIYNNCRNSLFKRIVVTALPCDPDAFSSYSYVLFNDTIIQAIVNCVVSVSYLYPSAVLAHITGSSMESTWTVEDSVPRYVADALEIAGSNTPSVVSQLPTYSLMTSSGPANKQSSSPSTHVRTSPLTAFLLSAMFHFDFSYRTRILRPCVMNIFSSLSSSATGGSDSAMRSSLLSSFFHLLMLRSGHGMDKKDEDESSARQCGAIPEPTAVAILGLCLTPVTAAKKEVHDIVSPMLLACICHPIVAGSSTLTDKWGGCSAKSKRVSQLYHQIRNHYKMFPGMADGGGFFYNCGVSTSLLMRIAQHLLFHGTNVSFNECGVNMLHFLLSNQCEGARSWVVTNLIPEFSQQLVSPDYFRLTEEEVMTYQCPEDRLSSLLVAPTGTAVTLSAAQLEDALKITNADRKKTTAKGSRKGQFGSDNIVEDEEWAQQIRREKAKKLGLAVDGAADNSMSPAEKAKRITDLKDAKLKASTHINILLRSLNAINAMLVSDSMFKEQEVSSNEKAADVSAHLIRMCLPHLSPLVAANKLAVVESTAFRCIQTMCRVHTPALITDTTARDMAASIKVCVDLEVFLKLSKSRQEEHYKELLSCLAPINRCLMSLDVFLLSRPLATAAMPNTLSCLSPSVIVLILPVLLNVLNAPSMLPGCECAFRLLCRCWTEVLLLRRSHTPYFSTVMGKSLFSSVLKTTLYVMHRYPRTDPNPEVFLIELLGSQTSMDAGDWTVLMSTPQIGLLSVEPTLRLACLRAMQAMPLLPQHCAKLQSQPEVISREWIWNFYRLQFDTDDKVSELAVSLWNGLSLQLPEPSQSNTTDDSEWLSVMNSMIDHMVPYFEHKSMNAGEAETVNTALLFLRQSAAKSLIFALKSYYQRVVHQCGPISGTCLVEALIARLQELFVCALPACMRALAHAAPSSSSAAQTLPSKSTLMAPPTNFARPDVTDDSDDHWTTRQSIAMCWNALWSCQMLPIESARCSGDIIDPWGTILLSSLDSVIVGSDCGGGVSDVREEVRQCMLTSSRLLVDQYGATVYQGKMMKYLQDTLRNTIELMNKTSKKPASSAAAPKSKAAVKDPKAKLQQANATAASFIKQSPAEIAATKQAAAHTLMLEHRHICCVILLGVMARHVSAKDDPVILVVLQTLLEALHSSNSETTQRTISDCLVPLMQNYKGTATGEEYLLMLLGRVLDTKGSSSERRGASYGLAAAVKGLGMPCLKAHDIVNKLKDECANSVSPNVRQGALYAVQALSDRLGVLFEPYVITIVPVLLKSFSHASDVVRDAAHVTTNTIMGKLSAHGVKQVLTPILQSLPLETQWKTRLESIRLLGSMAYCAPKQLAACLPQIVPRLVDATSDPHPKVKDSVKNALQDISSVIKNPEVSNLSPILLAALVDPASKTKDALESLLECEFMHSIDAPSLALLIPVLSRALRDRGADVKRKAAAITGNMISMVSEPRIIVPYLPQVIPGLKECLINEIPDVRAVSAKALGSLIGGVGEAELEGLSSDSNSNEDILPWLMRTLKSDSSPVERSGAAQGLAEISLALGDARVDGILSNVLPMHTSTVSSTREGVLWLLSFLPTVLKQKYALHVERTLPVVLAGLCDASEAVREIAMKAGQMMVATVGRNHTMQLLPSLLKGLFDEEWRIRQSSVILLGDLLYLVADAKAVGLVDHVGDEDDGAGSGGVISRVADTLRAHLGDQRNDAVLASLYMARHDVSAPVRQGALQVWKSIVSHSPKTLVEIMPILVKHIVEKLSGTAEDMRIGASKALGELVSKMGEKVLPLIIPPLRHELMIGDGSIRQGICIGLAEIVSVCTARLLEDYMGVIVPALQEALCDRSSVVRSHAATAFQKMFRTVGFRALDELIPVLLSKVRENGEDTEEDSGSLALLGLKQMVSMRHKELLEYLLPKLMTSPLTSVNSRALAAVVSVTKLANPGISAAMNNHYHSIIPFLTSELIGASGSGDESRLESVQSCAVEVMKATTNDALNYIVIEFGKQIEHETDKNYRRWGCWLLAQFALCTSTQFDEYMGVILKYLLSRVTELDKNLLKDLQSALDAVCKAIPLDGMMQHVEFIRNCLTSAASDARHRPATAQVLMATGEFLLPLFTLPKSLDSVFPVFTHTLMNGNLMQREVSALALGDIAKMTDPAVLKPYLIKTTGPLIRVVGDRFPSQVKGAILETLGILLDRGGPSLRAFVPQLQTTFVKALLDPTKQVRLKSVQGLDKLVKLTTRLDPLVNELLSPISTSESNAIKTSALEALTVVLNRGGDKATAAGLNKIKHALFTTILDGDDNVRVASAVSIGALSCTMIHSAAAAAGSDNRSMIMDFIVDLAGGGGGSEASTGAAGRYHGAAMALQSLGSAITATGTVSALPAATISATEEIRQDIFLFLQTGLMDKQSHIRLSAIRGVAALVRLPAICVGHETSVKEFKKASRMASRHFLPKITALLSTGDVSVEMKALAITAIKDVAKLHHPVLLESFQAVLPVLVGAVQGFDFQVKLAGERALKYALQCTESSAAGSSPSHVILQNYTSTSSDPSARQTSAQALDYMKRYLVQMSHVDSDDEAEDE